MPTAPLPTATAPAPGWMLDVLDEVPSTNPLAGHILRALARTHATILADGFGPVADALNRTWSEPRLVAVTLNGGRAPFTGHFRGIDDHGRLRLATDRDGVRLYDATEVALLRELD